MQPSLATLLKQAATEPGMRPAFFQQLLASEVWLPQASAENIGVDEVEIIHWRREDGSTIVPFFTDQAALQQACGVNQVGITLAVKQLLNLTLGQILFLNPELPEGKIFTVEETKTLLQHQDAALASYQLIENEQLLHLSALPNPPPQLVQSLLQLLSRYTMVRQAFLVKFRESDDQADKLMVALELDTGSQQEQEIIIQQTGNVAMDVLTEHEVLDVCVIDPAAAGLSHLLTAHFTPFYQRRWGSFLRDIQAV